MHGYAYGAKSSVISIHCRAVLINDYRHGFIQPAGTPVITPKRSVSAIPNPTQNFSTLEGIIPGDRLSIIDYTGRIIFKAEITDRTMRLDFRAYESGIYHVFIESVLEYKPIRIIKVE